MVTLLPADSVCDLSPATMMSVDVTNHNGPAATPPTSLSLRSSHNQLLSGDVVNKEGADTPPKCRKKYALTSIQAAMGLGDAAPASSSPSSSSSPCSTPNNPKLAKNGANQLRKAGHDHNKNTTGPETADPESQSVFRSGAHLRPPLQPQAPQIRQGLSGAAAPLPAQEDQPTGGGRAAPLCGLLLVLVLLLLPETKKDRRTGAKTDCALNRIQNLNPSDEELSWTTLSQESNSPEETGTHSHKHTT
uniref:Uncharacterized protein n=1 Tax=Labrus bergylta TaxID=56723 RepID=A0A3Q3FHU5_9LABR